MQRMEKRWLDTLMRHLANEAIEEDIIDTFASHCCTIAILHTPKIFFGFHDYFDFDKIAMHPSFTFSFCYNFQKVLYPSQQESTILVYPSF